MREIGCCQLGVYVPLSLPSSLAWWGDYSNKQNTAREAHTWTLFLPHGIPAHFHTVSQFHGVPIAHFKNTPRGFAAYPYSRKGVSIPPGYAQTGQTYSQGSIPGWVWKGLYIAVKPRITWNVQLAPHAQLSAMISWTWKLGQCVFFPNIAISL